MQVFVRGMAVVMQQVMGASGAESTNVAASIFMGQTEAPLTIRPFLAGLTRIRTVHHHDQRHGARLGRGDGGVRADRARGDQAPADRGDHDRAGHHHAGQDAASRRRSSRRRRARCEIEVEKTGVNVIDAAARGAGDGLHLALNIGGDADRVPGADRDGATGFWAGCTRCPGWAGCRRRCSRSSASSSRRSPGCWACRWKDCATIGNLLGTRLVLNEFVAFLQLGPMKAHARSAVVHHRHVRAVRLRQFQLDRDSDRRHRRAGADAARSDLARLGLRAVAAGTMANFMSACIAGMLL